MERTRILSGTTEGRYNISARAALAEEAQMLEDQIATADEDDPEVPILRARLDAIGKRLEGFPLPSPIGQPEPAGPSRPPTQKEAAAELTRRREAKGE